MRWVTLTLIFAMACGCAEEQGWRSRAINADARTLKPNKFEAADTPRKMRGPVTIDQAIEMVGQEGYEWGLNSSAMGDFKGQVYYRLSELLYHAEYHERYQFQPAHTAAWQLLMVDDDKDIYARLCAAYFLIDRREGARSFVEAQLASKDIFLRFNAAMLVLMFAEENPANEWSNQVLIELLQNGSIDEPVNPDGTHGFAIDPTKEYVETPIADVCWFIGKNKKQQAVPALISVLRRDPVFSTGASALGEVGDPRGIPILMDILKADWERGKMNSQIVTALGQLKCKDAVPILIARLATPPDENAHDYSGIPEDILDALVAIADKRAAPAIENYLKSNCPEKYKKQAQRALLQLTSPDPVGELLALFAAEPDIREQGEIMWVLVKYKDERIIDKFSVLARTSNSAYLRNQAIMLTGTFVNRKALLVLASLLDEKFPADLQTEDLGKYWPGLGPIDQYLARNLLYSLKEHTGQDFGSDRAKWEAWIKLNVKE